MHSLFLKPCMRNILARGKKISVNFKQVANGYYSLTGDGKGNALGISKALYENDLNYVCG